MSTLHYFKPTIFNTKIDDCYGDQLVVQELKDGPVIVKIIHFDIA